MRARWAGSDDDAVAIVRLRPSCRRHHRVTAASARGVRERAGKGKVGGWSQQRRDRRVVVVTVSLLGVCGRGQEEGEGGVEVGAMVSAKPGRRGRPCGCAGQLWEGRGCAVCVRIGRGGEVRAGRWAGGVMCIED